MNSRKNALSSVFAQLESALANVAEEQEERESLTKTHPTVRGEYKLAQDQEEHLGRLLKISEYSPVCRDSSETGLGKTFVFFSMASESDLSLFVICPSSITENIWSKHKSYTNTPKLKYIRGYASIANGEDGILHAVRDDDGKKTGKYYVEEEFKEMVEEGILLVCDEYHFAKNASNRSRAVGAMIKYVVDRYVDYTEEYEKWRNGEREKPKEFRSRVLVCSATQMDKESQTLGFLINLGYVDGPLISGKKDGLNTINYMKLLNACKSLAEDFDKKPELRKVEKELKVSLYDSKLRPLQPTENEVEKVDSIMYQLTKRILFDLITSEMKAFIPRLTFNGFFDFDRKKDDTMFKNALLYLAGASGEAIHRLSEITKGLILTQLACVYTSVRFLKSVLASDPTAKVCLSTRYSTQVLPYAKKLFEERNELGEGYTCLELTGEASTAKKKEEIVRLYQADTKKYRVLLISVQLGVGIDLHDVAPTGRPRTSIILRDFSPIDTHQMAGRFYRRGMYTFGNCYLFNSLKYGSAYNQISELLQEKSLVLKSVTKEQLRLGLKRSFPGYYPRCFMDGTIEANNGEELKILFINEEYLASKNDAKHGGRRLPDRALIARYIQNEKLPFVDPPKSFLPAETEDDFPSPYKKVDESFEGLSGIFWLNELVEKKMTDKYTPNAGIVPGNEYTFTEVDRIADYFDALVNRKKKLKLLKKNAKRKGGRVKRIDEDEEDSMDNYDLGDVEVVDVDSDDDESIEIVENPEVEDEDSDDDDSNEDEDSDEGDSDDDPEGYDSNEDSEVYSDEDSE